MYHQAKGTFVKQAHKHIPEGLYEEEHGREGFYGQVSHLYHRNAPTNWTRIEGPLKPHAFDTALLPSVQALNPVPDRVTVLHNDDVSVIIARPKHAPDWFFRNADGDELFFIHKGNGTIETDYGPLTFKVGDYVLIPRGTTYRFVPATTENHWLIFESVAPIEQPDRGLLGRHALYDMTTLQAPEPHVYSDHVGSHPKEWEVRVKRQNQITSIFYGFHPLDVEGWKGDLYPTVLNILDINPVMSHRVHLAPSVHSTFKANGFVVCSFLPRPLETEEGAERVPFYHRNIDYDEVLFYHDGDFFSRDGIDPGMITFHPQGIHHGPHPKAREASWSKTETEEVAVMIDTRRPLTMTVEAHNIEWKEYWYTWQTPVAVS